jgi:3-hydroxy acid dehydrogenase/malonic semialdehyde reductase
MEKKSFAFITGTSSGFGQACAIKLAKQGWSLIICARRKEKLETLADNIRDKYGVRVVSLSFDVRSEQQVSHAISSLDDDVREGIEILINNAGLAAGRSPVHKGSVSDWNEMIDTNVKGLLYVTRIIASDMKERRRGHIINISSIAGKEVYPDGNVYCASKHAVDALSKAMRVDLLPFGIRVTNIAPGAAETEFSLVRFKGDVGLAGEVYKGFQPLQAQDIAEAVYFAIQQPPHVNINDITIMPSAQASSMHFHKTN